MAWMLAAVVCAGTCQAAPDPLRVAVYAGRGAMPVEGDLLPNLQRDDDITAQCVSAPAIRAGVLREFDAVVFPAGFSSDQSSALGASGRDAIRRFVRAGGGYIGICAGAYLALAGRDAPRPDLLELVAATSVDPWRRGVGGIEIIPTGTAGPRCLMDYENGPAMDPVSRPELPRAAVLARYGDAPGPLSGAGLAGKPAIVAARHGEGRVLLFSPHPERRADRAWLLRQGVRWAGGRSNASREPLAWSAVLPPERLTIPVSVLPEPIRRALLSAPHLRRLAAFRQALQAHGARGARTEVPRPRAGN